MKLTVVVLALTLTPMLAQAKSCSHSEDQAMSCASGTVYDAKTGSCVLTTG